MVLKPARVYLDRTCILLPRLEQPKRILVYFFEGNDLADNFGFVMRRIPSARNGDTPAVLARYIEDKFGKAEWWRCHAYFAETVRQAAKLLYHRYLGTAGGAAGATFPEGYEAANKVWSAGVALPAPALYPPSRNADDPDGTIAFIVFDEALAWLRKHFAQTPVTIVYIPSPAAVYRYPSPVISVFSKSLTLEPVAKIRSDSQAICERIRALSLSHGAGFIDTRPQIWAAARQTVLHGPADWIHFNESGYRTLATILAQAGRDSEHSLRAVGRLTSPGRMSVSGDRARPLATRGGDLKVKPVTKWLIDKFEVPPLPEIGTKTRCPHVGFQRLPVAKRCPADKGVRCISKHVQTVVARAEIDGAILISFALWRSACLERWRGIGRRRG